MITQFDEVYGSLMKIIEVLGTFTFVVSGIRHAAAKHFDWFGGFICGIAVAIGGGTVRDVMLGVPPFWMTSSMYMICAVFAQFFALIFSHYLKKLDNAWFIFDTLGLALFTIAGIQKTLECGYPFWVAIIMGCITGSMGGVIRFVYWGLTLVGMDVRFVSLITFVVVCAIRFLAVRYHISFPALHEDM